MRHLISIFTLITLCFFCSAQEILFLRNGTELTIQSGLTITLQGGLNGTAGSSINNNGTIVIRNNTVANESNWTDASLSGILSGTGTVLFQSPFVQTITGPTQFYRLEVDNGGVLLGSSFLSINNSLVLAQGKIGVNGDLVSITNAAPNAIEAGSGNSNFQQSYIVGSLQRAIGANTGTYIFPVGSAANSNSLHFVNNNLTGITSIRGNFVPFRPGTNAGINVSEGGTSYTGVSDAGVWYISETGTRTGGSYDLLLYLNGFTGLSDNRFAILRRPDASSNAAEWQVPTASSLPATGAPGRTVASGFARRNNLTTFSQYGIGITSGPLPLNLVAFNGRRENGWHHLYWKTDFESNTEKFEVERSVGSAQNFVAIGSVRAAGNASQVRQYTFTDQNVVTGPHLYRLKMIDIGGGFTYSGIIRLDSEWKRKAALFPNPVVNSNATLQYDAEVSGTIEIRISDYSGRIVSVIKPLVQKGANSILIHLAQLPPGVYSLLILTEHQAESSIKFIKQ
ncbi:MAG TPA: T9SS type A sorting domain-containing protein [Lacibacter sp.]|nr:T9SS type A sorting domain-containing protein [Lacibacter sp.]HMO90300.1 T9SS type A sorting domain-containing protein [Lacibacter sp.]HMP85787.1 T9SS type A sorting domain-containing protein [Lacibacter sp.]